MYVCVCVCVCVLCGQDMSQLQLSSEKPYRIAFRILHPLRHFSTDYNPGKTEDAVVIVLPTALGALQFKTQVLPLLRL